MVRCFCVFFFFFFFASALISLLFADKWKHEWMCNLWWKNYVANKIWWMTRIFAVVYVYALWITVSSVCVRVAWFLFTRASRNVLIFHAKKERKKKEPSFQRESRKSFSVYYTRIVYTLFNYYIVQRIASAIQTANSFSIFSVQIELFLWWAGDWSFIASLALIGKSVAMTIHSKWMNRASCKSGWH